MNREYTERAVQEFNAQPSGSESILKESDIAHMPYPVKKYLFYTGAVGKNKLQNISLLFDAKMFKKPGASPMNCESVQYNFFSRPARIFYMKARMTTVPFYVLHVYSKESASMRVRVAGLFNAVDISGRDLAEAETVTILNDICCMAPAALADERITWEAVDDLSARVHFKNGPYSVSAMLYFNTAGELINFVSDDRSALQDDGSLKKIRWSTPLRDYKEYAGRKVPSYGEAIYHYPEGSFTYGIFTLKDIRYNVKKFTAVDL